MPRDKPITLYPIDSAPECIRADQEALCQTCGMEYRRHLCRAYAHIRTPMPMPPIDRPDPILYLFRICDGTWVKL